MNQLNNFKNRCLEDAKIQLDNVVNLLKNSNLPNSNDTKLILESSITELHNMYLNTNITVVDVLLTHWDHMIKVNKSINCTTEYCFTAYDIAKKLDIQLLEIKKNKNKELPDFFGIPITCKDELAMKGYYSTWGCYSRCENKCDYDAFSVDFLRNNGAIILARCNVPQMLFTCESVNHIFGRSNNPYNLERTPGGSSGGDAGNVVAGCAKIGITRDGAGSTRIPAAFCGLYGLKISEYKTKEIFPVKPRYEGAEFGLGFGILRGESFPAKFTYITGGPVSRDFNDVVKYVREYFNYNQINNKKAYRLTIQNYNFNEDIYNFYKNKKTLKIGVFEEFKFIPCGLGIKNSFTEAVSKLKSDGHEIIKLDIEDLLHNVAINYFKHFLQDNHYRYEQLKGESPIKEYKLNKLVTQTPNCLLKVISIAFKIIGNKRLSYLMNNSMKLKNEDINKHGNEVFIFYNMFHNEFKKHDIDVMIMPSLPLPALNHSESSELAIICLFYTAIFNLIDVAVGVVPLRLIKKGEDVYKDEAHKSEPLTKKIINSMKGSEGLPVTMQVVGLRGDEEKVLGCMEHMKNLSEINQNVLLHKLR